LGPNLSWDDFDLLYFTFAYTMSQLTRGPPLSLELISTSPRLPWPYGLRNVVSTYASLVGRPSPQPTENASAGLLDHHLCSVSELLGGSETTSDTDSYEEGDGWAGVDFFGLDNLEALRRFLGASGYLLEASDLDSNNGRYDPTRKCFICDGEHHVGLGGNEDLENRGDHTSVNTTPIVVAHTGEANMPPPDGPLKPQVEQLRELEQKLEEE
jgi:hypothetical protein